MQNEFTFRYPEPGVTTNEDGSGVLSIRGAGWFADFLRRIPNLDVDGDLCQEDWCVVVFARREGREFWVGISSAGEGEYDVHFHHGSFAWLQRMTPGGRAALARLIDDFRIVASEDEAVTEFEPLLNP